MRLRTASTALIATALLLAGCSGGADAPTDDGGTEPAPENTPEVVSIPVGEPFGEPAWSVQTEANPTPPLVASDRVVALVQGEVRAWDAEGAEAWQVPVPEGRPGDEAVLRQVDAATVAVVTTGETEGEGLDEGGYAATVTLIDLASGEATEVKVTDAESSPVLSEFGLAFLLPSGGAAVVTADGQTQEITEDIPEPTSDSGEGTLAIGTVGDIVVRYTEDGGEEQGGYETDSWTTGDLELLDYAHSSTIEAVDQGQGLLVVGAHTSGAGAEHAYAVVDAATGEIVTEIDSGVSPFATAVNSPDSAHGVAGSLVLSATEAQVIGGDGQQEVTLTAVADDGTAYGRASQGNLVIVPAGGEPETSALPEGAAPPVGTLSNGLAVHYDESSGIVTGNPIE